MTTAKSSNRTVVGASFTDDDLARLDAQRAQMDDLSRAGALKALWDQMGDEALTRYRAVQAADEADAESVEPLLDALQSLTDALGDFSHQRRAIGVTENQVAKLANVLAVMVERGDLTEITADQVDAFVHAQQGIERRLDDLRGAEVEIDALVAEARARFAPAGSDLGEERAA